MATTFGFKDILDLPEWRPLAVSPNAAVAGSSLTEDLRNSEMRHHAIFQVASATVLNQYHTKNNGWSLVGSPALTGTFGAGATAVMAPSRGPRGTLAAGASTTKVVLSTALPAAIGVNMLAGRGDGYGFTIRIIGNSAGGSGKVEERRIVSNSGGTTPTIYLDSALSFTPQLGDGYEILSGRVYMLSAGVLAAGMWKYYEISTNSFSGNLATTNLPATVGTDSTAVCLDEGYVPSDNDPGEGFVVGAGDGGVSGRALTATASAAGTLTGQAVGGDAAVLANEFRNFQIRIVKDTATPTAVGQRRRITSHTAGASPVYTVTGNWTVTPSATCQFVIENNNEIILWSSASTTTFTYAQDTYGTAQTGDTWSTTTYGVRGGASAAGVMAFQPFGVPTTYTTSDPDKNFRWSHIFTWRGGAANTLDVLDIAGGANGLWSNAITYGSGPTFTTGSCLAYDGANTINGGKFAYIQGNGGQTFYRFDAFSRQLNEWAQLRYTQGTAIVGGRLATTTYVDGTAAVGLPVVIRSSGAEIFQILAQR